MNKVIGLISIAILSSSLFALPQPGLMQYRLKNADIASPKFVTPENWRAYRNDADAAPVVTPGVLMGKKANVNGTTWNGVTYPFTNASGYWYEGWMKLEAGKTYSGYSRFDDGGCIYLDGVELYNQGSSSGYNGDTSRERHIYTPTQTGWYKVQLGLWDWVSNRSCQNYTIAGVQWSTNDPPVATGSGAASLWRQFWDADTDDALVAKGELFYTEDPTAVSITDAPTISRSGNSFVITAKTYGFASGGKVYAIYGPSYPFAYTNLLGSVSSGSQVVSGAIAGVPADIICRFGVVVVSDDGCHPVNEKLSDDAFVNSVITVELERETAEGRIDSPGRFVVTRPATATEGDFSLRYTFSGTAKAGKHFEATSGVVVISNGAQSATIEIVPHLRSRGSRTLVVTLDATNFLADPQRSSASMTIDELFVRKQIVFTVDGYDGESVVTNFPVLVRLSESGIEGFHYSDFKQAGGKDLRFVTKSGRVLPYDIQKWDENGTSLVWVKVPELVNKMEIIAYYDCDTANVDMPTTIWSDDFVGVWHLDEVTDGATLDASGHGLTATNRYPTRTEVAQSFGVVGGSIDNSFANVSRGEKNGFLSPAYTNFFNGSQFSVSGWFYYPSTGGGGTQRRYLSTKPKWDSPYGFELDTSSCNPSNICVTTLNSNRYNPNVVDRESMGWKKYTMVFDGSYLSFYTNGVISTIGYQFKDTRVSIYRPQHAYGLAIGNNASFGESGFTGSIDEVRFAMFAESADWIKAEYATESDPAFLSNTGATKVDRRGMTIIFR